MATYEQLPLIESNDQTCSAADSPARTSATQASARGSTANDPAYGQSTPELLASYDRATSSWRTSQLCLDGGLSEFSEIWPRSGLMRNGTAYRLPPLVPLTDATGSGSWPTPSASLHNLSEDLDNWQERRTRIKAEKKNGNGFGVPLKVAARMWPTPTSRDWKDGSAKACANVPVNALLGRAVHRYPTPRAQDSYERSNWKTIVAANETGKAQMTLTRKVKYDEGGGSLNPTWVEWLMGFPAEWTGLDASVMPSSRRSRKSSAERS